MISALKSYKKSKSWKDKGKKYARKGLRVTLVMGYEISSLIAGVHIKIFHPLPVKMSHARAQARDRMVEMSSRDIIEHRINHSFFIYISYQVYLNF